MARKSKAELRLEQEREELRQLLSLPGNRAWLWKLLAHCGVFHSTTSNDPYAMAVRSGKRDVGLWVLEDMFSADPDAFVKMQIEAKERDREVSNGRNSTIRTDGADGRDDLSNDYYRDGPDR